MRIGILTDIYKPMLNGVTNFVSLHKRELERQGHEVWVFTPGYTNYPDNEPRIVRSKAIPLSGTGYYLGFGYERRTRQILKEMDILHAQHPLLSGLIAVTFGRHYGIPVVFTNHTRYDLYAHHYLPHLLSSLSETFLGAFFPAFTQRCDLLIAPSLGLYEVLRAWGVLCRIEIVPNGIDVESFRVPQIRHTRSEVGIPEDARVAIFVGRMSVEKNVPFLLQAFALTAEEVSNAHLLLVGGGPELDDYSELAGELGISERVHFTDQVPYEDVPGYLALGDYFVTASLSEVHPLTVLEAMAASLPVLGIHSPGIADTVKHEYNGLLTSEDQRALASKMSLLFEDVALCKRLAEGARATSRHYSIENTTRRHIELYQELIEAKRQMRAAALARRSPAPR